MLAVTVLHQAWAIALKDLRIELRSREVLATTFFFAVMVVLLFSFAFIGQDKAGEAVLMADVTAGFIWIPVLFSAALAISRVFDRERENDTMRGLLLSPCARSSIFLGKAIAVALLLLLCQILVIPLVWFLFTPPIWNAPGALLLLCMTATIGISCVGATFAAMLLRTRARDVLFPVIVYPLLVPLFIAVIKGSIALMGAQWGEMWFWIRFLVAYDALFLVTALWSFESLVIE